MKRRLSVPLLNVFDITEGDECRTIADHTTITYTHLRTDSRTADRGV